ncbi:hypothetical protein [Xanthomonas oryzae]|nr:hypothetical protein [Xanthomonas oryzae]
MSARITDTHLRWIEQRLYNRPRKILGWRLQLWIATPTVVK